MHAFALDDLDLDQEAAVAGAEPRTDGNSGVVRLERATAVQVASSFKLVRGADLTQCFAGYRKAFDPTAATLTAAVTARFIEVSLKLSKAACAEWFDLGEIVKGVLAMKRVTEATLATVIDAMPAWATPQLSAATVGGFVDLEKAPLLFYADITRVRVANAMARELDPAGIDLAQLRAQWNTVRNDSSLDRDYLNPVRLQPGALDGNDMFKVLRAAFPLRGLALVATGLDAVDRFAAASDGPDRDVAFKPIAAALRRPSIKKRFYYARTGAWASNVLIVVDEHHQAWGMQMGRTE